MEFRTVNTKQNDGCFKRLLSKIALKKLASNLVLASQKSKEAAKDVLYTLPGVFSMTLVYGTYQIRLIKEADEFRIMDSSEVSENLLTLEPIDAGILADLYTHRTTLQHALAENRVRLVGKTKYAATIVRVSAQADKLVCSKKQLQKLCY